MIFSKMRDRRLVTVRRGGTLQDDDHRLLAVWAADCAGHFLHFFEAAQPEDDRPRRAIELAHAWARGEITMTQARTAAGHAMGAARALSGAAREAAYAAGQAAVWRMWQLTNWVQRPTQSGPHGRRLPQINVWRLVAWSASGSARSFPVQSAHSCSTTSAYGMSIAGSSSIADHLARYLS